MINPLSFVMAYTFILGAIVGSFLNVVIYRLPLGKGLGGRSMCPSCQKKIPWYDNIPIFGYFILGGKCRQCKAPFSIRYAMVELLTAILSMSTFFREGTVIGYSLWFFLFVAPLIVVIFIDWDHQIIPDSISITGIPVGILVQLYLQWPNWQDALKSSGAGIAIGGGVLYLIGTVYMRLRGREGLGGGDVKLCAMFGAFLGVMGVIFVFLFGSIFGSLYILSIAIGDKIRKYKRDDPIIIPFGPFLVGAAMAYYYWGDVIVNAYLDWAGLVLTGPQF